MQNWRRNSSQCLQRWSKVLQPHKKGFWDATETAQLMCAVEAYGESSWNKVAKHVPGRTDMQVTCHTLWSADN